MAVVLLFLVVVGVLVIGLVSYKTYQEHQYGPSGKTIEFEQERFRMLRYLAKMKTAINRINVIEDLDMSIVDFKYIINSLKRDNLIKTGPQSVKITTFGQQYHDVFIEGKESNGSNLKSK